jgi:2-keto-4-pentenoate hydratase
MPIGRVETVMLNSEALEAASALLSSAWTAGEAVPAIPEPIRPTTRAEGYAVQALTRRRNGSPLFGWKIAATSVEGQRHIGVDGPLAGGIMSNRVVADGGTVPPGANRMAVAEVEFAFRMGVDLPPRAKPYGRGEVVAAIGSLHPAIEVPDSRYEDFVTAGAPQLIADMACAHWFALGPAAPDVWRGLDLAAYAPEGNVAGKIRRQGLGSNVLSDPLVALTWLVNEVSGLGMTLRKGEVVTTGTCLKPMEIAPGDTILADFGALGRVCVHIG